jgi:hypothetical protein
LRLCPSCQQAISQLRRRSVDRKFMAMPPHSRFACPPSEVAERIAVVCDCCLFKPRQRRNRMTRGKSRLITTKNNIDRPAPTYRPQSATFYSLIIAKKHRPAATKPHPSSIGRRWVEGAIQFQNGRAFSLSCSSANGEKAGRWREGAICKIDLRCSLLRDSSDRLIQLTCCSRSWRPSA